MPAVDIKKATIDCMRNPISSDPLQKKVTPGDSVCLVVADCTRIWNQSNKFLVYIINELNLAGIPDTDICIVFAQGSHRAHTPEENIKVCGEEVCRRIKMYQHALQQALIIPAYRPKKRKNIRFHHPKQHKSTKSQKLPIPWLHKSDMHQ